MIICWWLVNVWLLLLLGSLISQLEELAEHVSLLLLVLLILEVFHQAIDLPNLSKHAGEVRLHGLYGLRNLRRALLSRVLA
mmetsp:Transcript_39237/g.59861  ORF Transcript_39237/g.59861 Transcript_39237/m.59861 type:complete len:81 (+) Transcript_39237:1994-2236(+)